MFSNLWTSSKAEKAEVPEEVIMTDQWVPNKTFTDSESAAKVELDEQVKRQKELRHRMEQEKERRKAAQVTCLCARHGSHTNDTGQQFTTARAVGE